MPLRIPTLMRLRVSCSGDAPAALNFGDCFIYALAMTTGEPLL